MEKIHKTSGIFDQNRLFLWILLASFGMILVVNEVRADDAPLYSARGKRDPFVPLITKTSKQSPGLIGVENIEDISIEGIVYDAKNGSMLVVNGSVLKEGEEQGSVKLLKITPEGALFSINGIETFKYQYQPENTAKES